MKYTDIHIHHMQENENLQVDVGSLLKAMDRENIEKIVLISDYGKDLRQQENIEVASKIISQCPERIYGLAWIEPAHNTPLDLLENLICEKKFKGFKMIPNHWYPYEERIIPYYEKIAQLGVPCLFHSGILYFHTYSSKYCRPAFYEDLIKIKNFRFALAHISWPWTDECIALYGQWRSARARYGITSEMFIDITPGTPAVYRKDALKKLISFKAEDSILFGTDFKLPCAEGFDSLCKGWKKRIQDDKRILKEVGVSTKAMEKIFYENFSRFFGK